MKVSKTGVLVPGLFTIVFLAGCALGTNSTNPTNPNPNPAASSATMQTGQWEFVATPSNGGKPVYFEVNLAGSNAAINSTVFNTALFQFGGGSRVAQLRDRKLAGIRHKRHRIKHLEI
jgi:hypothetical protein